MSTRTSQGSDLHHKNGSHLEALLRREETHITDDGFTERVMGALPPARARRWRAPILAAAALLGALVGVLVFSEIAHPLRGGHLAHLLWLALTWNPSGMALPIPPVPLALGLVALIGALAWTRDAPQT